MIDAYRDVRGGNVTKQIIQFNLFDRMSPCTRRVACFNERAVSLYKKLGFTIEKTVTHKTLGKPFYIMSRREV